MIHERHYCEDLTSYRRLLTREVIVGHIPLGGKHPVRLQSMTNTGTLDTIATTEQIKRMADAGADFARMTVRNMKEARNLENIKNQLFSQNYRIPLVADVHFNPRIAETAAAFVEKVRINPGNYALAEAQKEGFSSVADTFRQLISTLEKNQTALRIGVNHGSLSRRIMDQYGDTPRGMTESALEFLRICREEHFHQVVVSMKSSNTRVMVQANRLLVHEMLRQDLLYPLHLGVTEAGEGEDGRIKSAIGIGTLLNDGIGDTIRVSLTEAPEQEIPVARKIVEYTGGAPSPGIPKTDTVPIDPFDYSRRKTRPVANIGGEQPPAVLLKQGQPREIKGNLQPDGILTEKNPSSPQNTHNLIVPYVEWQGKQAHPQTRPLFGSIQEFVESGEKEESFVVARMEDINRISQLRGCTNAVLMLQTHTGHPVAEQRRFIFALMQEGIDLPVVLHRRYREKDTGDLRLKAACDTGLLFIDGLADGLLIENEGPVRNHDILNLSFGILQASRSRIYKTEFISCPGCGRTQFNLERTAEAIRQRMGHLKGLKIAIMGCIVNGPGEMADADYGYVGSAPGKITLYRNRQVVKRNVPEEDAVEELVKLIKDYGDWGVG